MQRWRPALFACAGVLDCDGETAARVAIELEPGRLVPVPGWHQERLIEVDVSSMPPSTSARVRVVVTDGVRSGTAVS